MRILIITLLSVFTLIGCGRLDSLDTPDNGTPKKEKKEKKDKTSSVTVNDNTVTILHCQTEQISAGYCSDNTCSEFEYRRVVFPNGDTVVYCRYQGDDAEYDIPNGHRHAQDGVCFIGQDVFYTESDTATVETDTDTLSIQDCDTEQIDDAQWEHRQY